MEHKIGEIITLPDGRKAEVVEGMCIYCMFYDNVSFYPYPNCGAPVPIRKLACINIERADHKNIIYKEIKEG